MRSCSETDLFWTFTNSAYNTIFKIFFIGSSAYTIYLMLNDYRPTHDLNLDTFKVEYLLGASGVLAVLFPYKWTPYEVHPPLSFPPSICLDSVPKDRFPPFLPLESQGPPIHRDPATSQYATKRSAQREQASRSG